MTDEWKHLSEAEYKQTAEKIGEAVMTTQKISDEARRIVDGLWARPLAYEEVVETIQSAIDAAHDKALEDAAKQFDNRPASYPAVAQEIRAMKVGK